MTTLAFTAALGEGGTIFGLTAASSSLLVQGAGIVFDSFVLFPELFPAPAQRGTRLADLNVQDTKFGSPSNRPYGSTVRVAGFVSWSTDLREVEQPGGGGKGGSGGDFATSVYFVDAQIRVAKTPQPISRVLKVMADGKPFWSAEPDISYSSDKISATNARSVISTTNGQILREEVDLVSDETAGGPDLSKLKSGKTVTIAGFTTTPPPNLLSGNLQIGANQVATATQITIKCFAVGLLAKGDTIVIQNDTGTYIVQEDHNFNGTLGTPDSQLVNLDVGLATSVVTNEVITPTSNADDNNGEWTVEASGNDESAGTSFVRISAGTQVLGFPPDPFTNKQNGIDTVTLDQELPTHSAKQVADVRFYDGSGDQQADVAITDVQEGQVGAGQVMASRGRHSMLLDDLALIDFANRLPNFEMIVEVEGEQVTLADALKDMLVEGGLTESEVDTSALSSLVLKGRNKKGPQVTKTWLQPLMIGYQIFSWEEAGVQYWGRLDSVPTVSISKDDLGAAAAGTTAPHGLRIGDQPEAQATNMVEVRYLDPEKEYQTNHARALRPQPASGGDLQSVDLDFVLSEEEAQKLANTLYAQSEGQRRPVNFTLPPSYIGEVRPGQRVLVSDVHGQDWDLLLTRRERGSNMVLSFDAREYDEEVYTQPTITTESAVSGGGGIQQDGPTAPPPPVTLVAMDLPSLEEENRNTNGFYLACYCPDTTRPWRGASVYRSTDSGSTYAEVTSVENQATVARMLVVPDTGKDPDVIDTTSSVRIEVLTRNAPMASVTEAEMLLGNNMWAAGGEIFGAQTVTLVSRDDLRGTITYDLTNLKRGLRDTDDAMDTHVVGETMVNLDGPGVKFVPTSLARIGDEELWKAVTRGGQLAAAVAVPFENTGRKVQPFRVANVQGSRDGSDNLTTTWAYQTRAIVASGANKPLEEDSESYKVEYLDGTTVVRTRTVTSPTDTYTAAEQTADGLTPGDPVDVRITQLSNRLDGRPRTTTV